MRFVESTSVMMTVASTGCWRVDEHPRIATRMMSATSSSTSNAIIPQRSEDVKFNLIQRK